MFKVLILQHLYNLSDDETEYQIRDRLSFSRFLGLKPEQSVPDAKTIWLFREQLVKLDLIQELFIDFDVHLTQAGFMARKGQIIDLSFVEVPKQRNNKAENDQIKVGIIPGRFTDNDAVKSQKDYDARWSKKNNQSYYSYKNHISIDKRPRAVDEMKTVGDWQIDTVIGKNHKDAIATIVDKKSRFQTAALVSSK